MPAMIVLKKYPKEVLVVMGARLAEVTWFYTVVTFALAYATNTLGIDRMVMLDATIWGALVALFTMPLFGILGDRLGFKWVFMAGSVGILLFSPLFFSMLSSLNVASINLAMIIAIGLVYACVYVGGSSKLLHVFG
jgi:MFS family permease